MEFAHVERLAFLLLLPLLYLLSLPPRPRQTVVTAHLSQWLEAHRKLARRPVRFRWWRFLLLAAAFLAVVLAHTGPRLPGRQGATELVVVVDSSASMAARPPGGGPSAFDRARDLATGLLARVPPHVDLRLALCAADIQVHRGDRDRLRQVLQGSRPGGAGGIDLARLAAELAGPTTAVWTVTDGLGPTRPPDTGALRLVGEALPNAGLSACSVEDDWPLPEVRIAVEVHNAGTAPAGFELRCSGGSGAPSEAPIEAPIEAPAEQRIEVAAGTSATARFVLRRGGGGAVRVAITRRGPPGSPGGWRAHTDGLGIDDAVTVELPPPPRPTLAVRAFGGEPPPELEAGARALAAECGGRLGDAGSRAGFLLVEGGAYGAPPEAGRMITFGTDFGAAGIQELAGRPLDWDRSHPLTRGLDLSELRVERALRWGAPGGFPAPGDRVLLRTAGESGSAPLAVLRTGGEAAAVHLAFRLQDSNFGRLAAFPQFLRRSLAAAYGSGAEARVAGDPLAAAESRLVPAPGTPRIDRELPPFARSPDGLAVPLLVLALLLLALRVYV